MTDRRKTECITAEEIAQAKIGAIQVREGDPAREDVLRAVLAQLQERFGDKAQGTTAVEAGGSTAEAPEEAEAVELSAERTPETAGEETDDGEVAPEVLERCQEQLKRDFDRGIVCIEVEVEDGEGIKTWVEATPDQCTTAFTNDKTAGQNWERDILPQLTANDNALLKRAALLQGMGELVGVDHDGNVLIISRGDREGNREPERFGFRATQVEMVDGVKQPKADEKPVRITTDTPDREALMDEVRNKGLFADAIEIRDAVKDMDLELPPDSPDYVNIGLVAAVEVVTGKDFVRGASFNYVDAVMDFDHSSRNAVVRVVSYVPLSRYTDVGVGVARNRIADRGAVCVLRGSKILET